MRRKIWEDLDTQCSIIGTCLSLRELRRIARQTNLELPETADEFEVHTTFVRLCGKPGPAAKAVNKLLDKKYAGAVRRFSRAGSDGALLELWAESLAKGDVPGPYWAVMTHPHASPAARRQVFGHVHMLSHLVGSSNRADIECLTNLKEQLGQLQERSARIKAVYRKRLKQMVDENRTLTQRLSEADNQAETLRREANGSDTARLARENKSLREDLESRETALAQEQAHAAKLSRELELGDGRLGHLEQELAEKNGEAAFLENELQRLLAELESEPAFPGGCEKAGTPECPGPMLCGKRILYVGGRANLVHHYRNVVERHGGEFLHHDGGLEQSRHALPKLINGVDAVLCPVDCVSHDACQCVKELCKHTMKPCKLMRSAGLSSLVRSLEDISTQAENPPS